MSLPDMYDYEEEDAYQSVLFILRGASVLRFHNVPMIKEVTVGHHEHGVISFIILLTQGKASANLLMAGATHDMNEQVDGDMPAPTKRKLGISQQMRELGEKFLARNGALFRLTSDEHMILKIADYMEGMLTCVNERRLGNRYVEICFKRFLGYLDAYQLTDYHHEILAAIRKLWEESL